MSREPEPRVVRTVEELEALPEGTFLRIAGWVYLLHEGKWYLVNTRDMILGTHHPLGGRTGLNHIGLRHHLPANVLTAQPAISAEQVEAMARDLYEEEANDSDGFDSWPEWDSHDNITRDIWRHRVHSMLRAAGLTVAGESDG